MKKLKDPMDALRKARTRYLNKNKLTPFNNEYFEDVPMVIDTSSFISKDRLVVTSNINLLCRESGVYNSSWVSVAIKNLYEEGTILDYSVNMFNHNIRMEFDSMIELQSILNDLTRVDSVIEYNVQVRERDRKVKNKKEAKSFIISLDYSN